MTFHSFKEPFERTTIAKIWKLFDKIKLFSLLPSYFLVKFQKRLNACMVEVKYNLDMGGFSHCFVYNDTLLHIDALLRIRLNHVTSC